MLREASRALLREQQPAVGDDIELALLALDRRRAVLCPEVDLGRETRGPAVVAVSDGAVEDADLGHARSLATPYRYEDGALVAALHLLLHHHPDAADVQLVVDHAGLEWRPLPRQQRVP